MRSLPRQRPINGLCVAWNPLIAPHDITINRHGKMLSFHVGLASIALLPSPSHISGMVGHFTNSITSKARAINSSEAANKG